MAIDTALKRRASAGVSIGYGITPDATAPISWRVTVAWNFPTGGLGAVLDSVDIAILDALSLGVIIMDSLPIDISISDRPSLYLRIDDDSL